MFYPIMAVLGIITVWLAIVSVDDYSSDAVAWWFIMAVLCTVLLFITSTRFPHDFVAMGMIAIAILAGMTWLHYHHETAVNVPAVLTIIAIVASIGLNHFRTDVAVSDTLLPSVVASNKGVFTCEGEAPITVYDYSEEIYGSSVYYRDALGNSFMRVPTIPCSYQPTRDRVSR